MMRRSHALGMSLAAWLIAIPLWSPGAEGEGPLSPRDALATFAVPDDLAVDLVLSEPIVAQPVFLTFDERGRMWVVQYLQYPSPAGLTLLSRDEYWRSVYDKVPSPPPNHVRGKDKITIHEDTDGDGEFDLHKVFVDGLNIATACAIGRGGIWVLNPPYLLFYPDANQDDQPDADPVVHLQGFGLEDTHSVVNSLCWGPDGWLYAAQGSTVTAHVTIPGSDAPPISSMGQLIWRYHPEEKIYEVFSEGGGNAFGVEMDSQGRIFSGHNGGNTRGFHYQLGAYLQKGFGKHGPLSNPYAFGYFPPMSHPPVERFSHAMAIYEAAALPERYRGLMFAVCPLQSQVMMSRMFPVGSTFRTEDMGPAIAAGDPWFRPVDIKLGPDGALYIADWYDRQVNHFRNHEGQIAPDNGRIYRIRAKDATPAKPENLGALTSSELVRRLSDSNQWTRETARRVLADRHDPSVANELRAKLVGGEGLPAVEALRTLFVVEGVSASDATVALHHHDWQVRLAIAQLLGSDRAAASQVGKELADAATRETNREVRAQLACTARRLPVREGMLVVVNLIRHDEDRDDPRIPLLIWWALESACASDPTYALSLWDDAKLWSEPIVQTHLLERIMRRFAAAGTRKDLGYCAELLRKAPDQASAQALVRGFEAAYTGRTLPALTPELAEFLAARELGSLALRIKLGDASSIETGIERIQDANADLTERMRIVESFAEAHPPAALDPLLELVARDQEDSLRSVAILALGGYDDSRIPSVALAVLPGLSDGVKGAAIALMCSRPAWALAMLDAIDRQMIRSDAIPTATVRALLQHREAEVARRAQSIWSGVQDATPAERKQEIDRLTAVVKGGKGDPYQGRELFRKSCVKCHTLFGEGGFIGPDLTSHKRSDLGNLMLSVVHPSVEIREGFEHFLAQTNDGRLASGFLVDQDAQTVFLRGQEGQTVALARAEIESLAAQPQSLMPDDLLKGLSDQQVRDLFAYLRSSQPLNR